MVFFFSLMMGRVLEGGVSILLFGSVVIGIFLYGEGWFVRASLGQD